MISPVEADKGKVLVIEDEVSLQAILRFHLQKAGYWVEVAGDGVEGLSQVEKFQPDLILMDVMMPRMDGNELCRRLKMCHHTRQIPIIMLTARTAAEDKLTSLTQGVNDYMTKPYERQELLMRVRNLMQWGRMQRDANPLTGLPGNIAIETELQQRIDERDRFAFMHLDIDNFKAFNDFYNYQKGDQALRLTALILQRVVDDLGSPGDFVGHIGGDDFVLILDETRAGSVGDEILRRFDEEIPSLYSKTDRARGYIQVVNRTGQVERFPLMTLTIAAVSNETRRFSHVAGVSDIAAELKHFGKQEKRSIIVWDRRES